MFGVGVGAVCFTVWEKAQGVGGDNENNRETTQYTTLVHTGGQQKENGVFFTRVRT